MKKTVVVALLLVLVSPVAAHAKTLKEAVSETSTNVSSFFKREGDRSGTHLPKMNDGKNFLKSINPVDYMMRKQDEYNARKAASPVK